jgi:YYY domain-containing protein
MLSVLVWWFWLQIMGLAALPLAYRLFRRLPDRGYTFARPLGLLLATYVLWLGGSLGLLRNSLGGILFSILVVAVLSLVVYRRGRGPAALAPGSADDPGLLPWLRSQGRLVLAVELLFAAALALWSLLRAYSPELTTAGGEKFMEIMYLNSIGRSEYFPPHDAWLSGYGISYYYFGYVMIAALARLSGFPAHLIFNVGLASLFALTCTGAFGLVYNLVKGTLAPATVQAADDPSTGRTSPLLWGLLGAVLVAVLGNLEGFLEVLYAARLLPLGFWQWLDIEDINLPFDPAVAPSLAPTRSGWWWWRASRVIHDLDPLGNSMGIQPIDEFPGFSFLLGDMHPHVLALPFVLLALALALNALLWGQKEEEDEVSGGSRGWLALLKQPPAGAGLLLVSLCLGALAFLNTWDFPIYWLVFLAAYGLGRWDRYGRSPAAQVNVLRPLARDVAVTGVAVAVLGFLLYLPFYIGFQSQAGGLLPTLYTGTRFRQYFVMFGPFLVAIAGLLAVLAVRLKRGNSGRRLLGSWAGWIAVFLLLPLVLMLLIVLVLLLTTQGREMLEGIRHIPAVYEVVGDASWGILIGRLLGVKLRTWVMPLVVAGLAAMGMVLLQHSGPPAPTKQGERTEPGDGAPGAGLSGDWFRHPSVRFVLLCAVVGMLLTLSVEFVYLTDNFRVRMNTIFKFYFQAWVLMAVASAFAAYWLSRRKSWLRSAFLVAFWLLVAMGMFYPVLGNASRAGNFGHTPTLDGTAYLASSKPDDHAAIAWLNENVEGAPVILEAPGTGGSSYVYEGRVSALTGLPTLLGWAGHEGQWRGSYDVQHAREPDIETIYNTLDREAALTLLDKYDITYIYVGPLERTKYDARALGKFGQFMDIVYQEGDVTIYKKGD